MNTNLQITGLSLSILLTAALASAAPYVSPRGYSLNIPPGWRVAPNPLPGRIRIEYKQSGSVAAAFGVDVGPQTGDLTLEAAVPGAIAEYKRRFSKVTIKSQTFSSLGGEKDFDIVAIAVLQGHSVCLRQVGVLKNNSLYVFTAGCREKDQAKFDPTFAQILASVRWKGQPR